MSSAKSVNGNTEQLLTVSEVASILSVNRGFVAKMVESGEVKAMFVGTHRRVPRWAIKEWQEVKVKELEAFTNPQIERRKQ